MLGWRWWAAVVVVVSIGELSIVIGLTAEFALLALVLALVGGWLLVAWRGSR